MNQSILAARKIIGRRLMRPDERKAVLTLGLRLIKIRAQE